MSLNERPQPLPMLGANLAAGEADASRAMRVDAPGLEAILPAFMDSLSDAIVVLDRERRVVAANRRYLEEFGVHREQVVGALCTEALRCSEFEAGASRERCVACRAFDEREPQRVIRTLSDANGVQRRWEASFSPIVGAGGTVTHLIEVWRDITDRSTLEAQLAHSERLASVGALAAGVAHEINNPLASILAGVESLSRCLGRRDQDPGALAEAGEILSILENEVIRCRETTEKLMLLAQPYSAQPTWVDLNRAVRDTISLLSFHTRKQGIQVDTDLPDTVPEIWARESGIRGVCMNIIMNAVQAMPDGGSLRVSTGVHGPRVVLQIEDTGPGVPPALLTKIFEPFFTTKPAGQGTGLGLFVTNAVVTRNGGTVRAENRDGGGARFVVDIPVDGSGGVNR